MTFSADELDKMTNRIQNAGTEVVTAKAGAVSIDLFGGCGYVSCDFLF